MALYSICGFTLESNIALPELLPAYNKKPELAFRLLHAQRVDAPLRWLHHYPLFDGRPWLSVGKLAKGYLLRFPDLADFHVFPEAADIRYYLNANIPFETIRHLFLNQVIPLILSERGKLVLHASAVVTPKGAIVFLGETGQGKSTLTASFAQRGFSVLTDDCLLVEEQNGQLFGIPSYPGLRLWPDSISALFGNKSRLPRVAHYTDKKRFTARDGQLQFSMEPVPLHKIYVLVATEQSEPSMPTIDQLSPRDAFIELIAYSYRLRVSGHKRLNKEFERIGRAASSLSLSRLTSPTNLSLLPVVQNAILADLEMPTIPL